MPTIPPIKVCYFDAAISPGGTTTLTQLIFSNINRKIVTPRLFAALSIQEASKRFKENDIVLLFTMNLSYTARENLLSKLQPYNKYLVKISIYLFSLLQLLSNVVPFLKILKALHKEKPDIIHIHNFEPALLAAYILKTPVIWHFHGIPNKPGKLHKLLQPIIKKYLCISAFVKDKAIEHNYSKHKLITLLNPGPSIDQNIVTRDIRTEHLIDSDAILISHFGRLIPWKGQLEFLQAFALAKTKCSKLVALLAGDEGEGYGHNYKEKLLTYIKDNNLTKHVIFTGHIDNPQAYMAASDIIVHSSIEPEPFGLVITEAMANGTCVICSNIGAPPEIIDHEVTGLIVNPNNSNELASAIIRLYGDTKLRSRLASNAKQQSILKFDPLIYTLKLESLYSSIGNSILT
ncbi:glycosyltransferase family 4 protein [Dasania marina]|uniref:glycosyltransferase family 4 protein n=1 Tax=Dasania marina TaxID=471499 RepID=UPI0003738D3F|nr:glycosyltransferase family 4 protein [Dasania marina]